MLKLGATIAGFLLASAATAQENTMIVFDASGSMWGQLDGRAKIEIARDAFEQSRDLWAGNPSSDIGLIAFGHRRKGDCSDIEVLVEPTPGAADVVIENVSGLSPKGKTPLSDSVRLAAEKLRYTEDKATVILFSDGVETCKADPCATSAELEELGIDFTAHVIGLGIATDDDKEKLRCLAENTGGLYRDAADTGSLIKAFAEVKSADLVTVTASDAPETLIDTVVQIILAEGTVRPNSVALRATNVTSGERRNLGNLTGADQIIQGLAVSLPAGEWRIEAISPEGSGAIEVDVRPNLETVDVPFKAALARFSLADGSPYLLGVEHGFFLTPSAALQANAEFTVGLVARGANADGAFVDYEYRFGTDGSGMSYHTFVSPDQAGPYDVIVANGSDVLARFPVTYAQNVVPKWNGATRGSPGGRLDIKITGDTYYYNSLILTRDGKTISEVTVDGAVSKEGWQLQLPDTSGVYTLIYAHSSGGDLQQTQLAEIVVGDVTLPDDPDTVAPPAAHNTMPDATPSPASQHSNANETADQRLRHIAPEDTSFACTQPFCLHSPNHIDAEDIPLHEGFGIANEALTETGRPSFEVFNLGTGEWIVVNPLLPSALTECRHFGRDGKLADGTDQAPTDSLCTLSDSGSQTTAQARSLEGWINDRNEAMFEGDSAGISNGDPSEIPEDLQTPGLFRTWTLADAKTFEIFGLLRLAPPVGPEEVSGSLLIYDGRSLGVPAQEYDPIVVDLIKSSNDDVQGLMISAGPEAQSLHMQMSRPPHWDGKEHVFHGMIVTLPKGKQRIVSMF